MTSPTGLKTVAILTGGRGIPGYEKGGGLAYEADLRVELVGDRAHVRARPRLRGDQHPLAALGDIGHAGIAVDLGDGECRSSPDLQSATEQLIDVTRALCDRGAVTTVELVPHTDTPHGMVVALLERLERESGLCAGVFAYATTAPYGLEPERAPVAGGSCAGAVPIAGLAEHFGRAAKMDNPLFERPEHDYAKVTRLENIRIDLADALDDSVVERILRSGMARWSTCVGFPFHLTRAWSGRLHIEFFVDDKGRLPVGGKNTGLPTDAEVRSPSACLSQVFSDRGIFLKPATGNDVKISFDADVEYSSGPHRDSETGSIPASR